MGKIVNGVINFIFIVVLVLAGIRVLFFLVEVALELLSRL